jgi:hypothetical protein
MKYTPRESTVPNDYQLAQKAARYAELHPDGAPAKPHRLIRMLRRVLPGGNRDYEERPETEPHR